jgi:hypothetical protein
MGPLSGASERTLYTLSGELPGAIRDNSLYSIPDAFGLPFAQMP